MSIRKTVLLATAVLVALGSVAPVQAAGNADKREKRMVRLIAKADANGDQKVSRQEFSRQLSNTFAAIDANGDGGLSMSELEGQRAIFRAARQEMKANGTATGMIRVPKAVMKHFDRIDANGDGRLSMAEIGKVTDRMFTRRDRNKDGYISRADLSA